MVLSIKLRAFLFVGCIAAMQEPQKSCLNHLQASL